MTVGTSWFILHFLFSGSPSSYAPYPRDRIPYKNNYDRINVTFPKGQKEHLKEHASKIGESVNAFIVRSVNETLARDNENK